MFALIVAHLLYRKLCILDCFNIGFSIIVMYRVGIYILNGILFFCLIEFIPLYGYAEESSCPTKHQTFTIYFENDVFAHKDEQYTNGLKLTWCRYGLSELPEDIWTHEWLYPVIKFINFYKSAESEKVLTFSMGQNIFTPENITTTELIKNDRPYAGITYAQFGFHKKTNHHMHTLGLCVGIVGPASYADKTQIVVHKILNHKEPNGWDNQLKDEPVIGLVYGYKIKLVSSGINSGFGGDMIFNTAGNLGNAITFYKIGLLTRYGWNIPNDSGNFPIQSATCFNAEFKETNFHKKWFGLHLFFSVNSKVVLRNIFLDGNTFRDSHSVEKKPIVGSVYGGIGLITGCVKTVLSYLYQTKLFECQKKPQIFGSISISFQY